MALTKFGEVTKTVFINEVECDKLHLAFEVENVEGIIKGQPVVLTSDGKIQPVGITGADFLLGYAVMNGKQGDLVTVAVRGYAVIFAEAAAPLDPGLVHYAGIGTDPFYTKYADATATPDVTNGFALDLAVAAGDLIRVLVF